MAQLISSHVFAPDLERAAPASQMDQAKDALDIQLDGLRQVLGVLELRLSEVLKPYPVSDEGYTASEHEEPISPLVAYVSGRTEAVRHVNRRIEALLANLSL